METILIPSVYVKPNMDGDFKWMITQSQYDDALFIYNENVETYGKWNAPSGTGNACVRKYNQYRDISRPRSVGIVTGIRSKKGGFNQLTPEIKAIIDKCFEDIKIVIQKHKYTKIIYSAEQDSDILGVSIFTVGYDVRQYITDQIKALKYLKI